MVKQNKEVDLLIIGGGPAGLTAAIYAVRGNLEVVLLESEVVGGQVASSYTIENYPGFIKIIGKDLSEKMLEQAMVWGTVIEQFDSILSIKLKERCKIIETERYTYICKAMIIATGAKPKKLPILSESKYQAKGVHYCGICDGAMYKDKDIAVVGGGNSALQQAIYLTNYASKVYIIRRHDYFNGEKHLIKEVENNSKIHILYNTDLIDVFGDDFVEGVRLRDLNLNKEYELKLNAVFGFIQTEPQTELFKENIKLDDKGYIITDENMQTNIEGVYAVGDVRQKKYRQITTAVSDGTIAGLECLKYINKVGE